MKKSFVISRSVCFEIETLNIVGNWSSKRQENFSKTVNFLIRQSDYLIKKIDNLRSLNEQKKELQEKYYPKDKQTKN